MSSYCTCRTYCQLACLWNLNPISLTLVQYFELFTTCLVLCQGLFSSSCGLSRCILHWLSWYTPRSTTSWCKFHGLSLICWKRKRMTFSKSSIEADYKSVICLRWIVWLKRLLFKICVQLERPTPLHGGNAIVMKIISFLSLVNMLNISRLIGTSSIVLNWWLGLPCASAQYQFADSSFTKSMMRIGLTICCSESCHEFLRSHD